MIIIFSFLVLTGLILQIVALFVLQHGLLSIFLALSMLLVGSFCIITAIDQYKSYYRFYTTPIRFMIFLIVFFIPVLGVIAGLLLMRWLWQSQQNKHKNLIHDIVISNIPKPLRSRYGIGGLRVSLQSRELPIENRVEALKALSLMPPRNINNLVRTVLPDTNDELRLLAFYILSKQEKKIVPKINKALRLLKHEESPYEKAKLERWIAYEYWELVYCNLIEPGLMDFVLVRVLHFAKLAQEYFHEDSNLWLLQGRAHFYMNQFNEASEAFAKALSHGASKNRIIPYLVEIYFYQRNFTAIKALIKSQSVISGEQFGKALMNFWSIENG